MLHSKERVSLFIRHPISGVESVWEASVVPLLSLKFGGDSGYQNTSEFLAATIGILTCLRTTEDAESHVVIDLRGDSVSALQWANTSRFNSESVNRAAILFTLLLVRQRVVIANVKHVAGECNGICNDLSRRDVTGTFRTVNQLVPGAIDLKAADDWRVLEAIRLCDLQSQIPFEEVWKSVGRVVENARGECDEQR